MKNLTLNPISFKDACDYVKSHHRHLKPPIGHKFSISVLNEGEICGVIMVGRPVNRVLDDGMTLEVNRCATNGTKNACSLLYSASWRVARNLGYTKIITYTLEGESGASLRGAGWINDKTLKGRVWSTPSRERPHEPAYLLDKLRWCKS